MSLGTSDCPRCGTEQTMYRSHDPSYRMVASVMYELIEMICKFCGLYYHVAIKQRG